MVLPVQNRDEVVGRAVASVLAQTFGNLELLVIDLGSSDRTLDAVRAVADRRVTIVDVEQLAGVIVDQLAELFDEEIRKVTRKTAGLLAPPPSTQGPQGGPARRSTFKEVRRAVA